MFSHLFGALLHSDQPSDITYLKCKLCGKVMFTEGDPDFNMVCKPRIIDLEKLRTELEKETPSKPDQ